MGTNLIDASLLRRCFIAGAKNLDAHKAYINELNVFPVPDGDTGTNMTMTVMSAANAIAALKDPDIAELAKTMSSGALRGARGNSGVIMSQLIRGFCKTVGSAEYIDSGLSSRAVAKAVETAYKAVMKPKEGTILTVAKGFAEKSLELSEETDDICRLCRESVAYGNEILLKTPDMLPVLKEAGVVDSGGQGLICFLEGVLEVLEGRETDYCIDTVRETPPEAEETAPRRYDEHISTDDIKFGYCTEFIVNLDKPLPDCRVLEFKTFLEGIGDSIVCVDDDDMIKVHVHTNHPGLAFEKGLEIGKSLSRMKVDNMREEHEERLIKNASRIAAMEKLSADKEDKSKPIRKPCGFIAVCTGSGFERIFKELGASYVLEGGQTMNPSTEDILKAVEAANADEIYILPNNKNIILASEQAAGICRDVKIHVVPTRTIPQGIAAMINFTEGLSAEENMDAMIGGISQVKTGELTYAVRHTVVEGTEIREGDILGIGDRGILAVGQVLNETALLMIDKMADEDSSMITIYVGEGIDDESAAMLAEEITARYPDLDVETERGEQPVYYYIISVE